MQDIKEGETAEVQGSAVLPYILKNTGGVFSCSCMAWRNQSQPIEKRTCKHLRKYLGDTAEETRLGGSLAVRGGKTKKKETKVPPALLLLHRWTPAVDPTGWGMSEKFDGVRAYWNGKELISRLGNKFYAPKSLTDLLPKKIHLDGELWIGRGQFQKTVSIVRRQDYPKEWSLVKYLVFDVVPDGKKVSKNMVFEDRYLIAGSTVALIDMEDSVELILQHECKGKDDLLKELKAVDEIHGEGMVLRDMNAIYESGKSHTSLKVKSAYLDPKANEDEATIIGHTDGKGRHKGRLGALVMRLANGKEFKLSGMSDKLRDNPPKIGELVTFSYIGLTDDGKPKFAAYKGPAIDKCLGG